MNTHTPKVENRNGSVANAVSQRRHDGVPAIQLEDNRTEAHRVRTLQELANSSTQTKKVAQFQAMANTHSVLRQPSLQKPGRVKPVMQLKSGVYINDDKALEAEADVMGAQALQMKSKEKSSFWLHPPVTAGEKPIQRVIDIKGDNLQGNDGAKRLLTNNRLIPGTVNSIKEHLEQLHQEGGAPYTSFEEVTLKIYKRQGMPYVGVVNNAAVDLRMANPAKEFPEKYRETGRMSVHHGLVELGIRGVGDLKKWFIDHDAELNAEIMRVYDEMDRMVAGEFGVSLEDFPEDLKQPRGTRKGLCGQTSNAVLRYLASKYPALYEIGKIQQQGGEQHQFLIFTNGAIEQVLVDPTYRQFDKDVKWSDKSHIWVGPPADHPFPKETENRKDAKLDLKFM